MKYEKEITVAVNTSIEELIKFLEKNNYKKIDNYIVDDIYYVDEKTDLHQNTLDIFKRCVLVRTICENKYIYIEVEENEKYDTIEKLVSGLEKTNIDYNKNNYFVKKAQVVFEEQYGNNC